MALREILASFGFTVDAKELEKGNDKVNALVKKVEAFGVVAAAAFVAKKVIGFTAAILQDADALAKQSGALGVSADQLQGWQYAASLSGSSADEFTSAFTKFTRNINEASESVAGPAAKALKQLGVDIKNGAPIDLLEGVVAGLEGIEDPAKRTALVMDLFGKSGAKLLPLFSEGNDGIRKMREELAELGVSFDAAFLKDAQEVNDNLDRMKMALMGMVIQGLKEALPALKELTIILVKLAKGIIYLVKNTKTLSAAFSLLGITGILKLHAKLGALKIPVGTLGIALRALGGFVLKTVLPFLILEDALQFLTGGKSLIGEGFDKIFGEGTTGKLQAFFAEVGAEVKGFFADLIGNPTKFLDDMTILFDGLRSGKFWEFIFGKNALEDWSQFWSDVTSFEGLFSGPSKEEQELKAGYKPEGFGEKKTSALDDLTQFVSDATNFGGLFSGPSKEQEYQAGYKPDAFGGGTGRSGLLRGIGAPSAAKTEADFVRTMAAAPTTDALAATAVAPTSAVNSNNVTLTNSPTVNVNVAAGTPAEITRAVSGAASKGASIDLAATKAALVTTGG